MSRLPLRLRLTLAFGLVMAIVLTVTGLVVYDIFRSDLNNTIDNSLRRDECRTHAACRRAPRPPAALAHW